MEPKPEGNPCSECGKIIEAEWNNWKNSWQQTEFCDDCYAVSSRIEKQKKHLEYVDDSIKRKIGNVFSTADLKDFEKVSNYVFDFCNGIKKGLYIFGPTGSGKTHLVAAILRYKAKKNTLPAPDLIFDIRESGGYRFIKSFEIAREARTNFKDSPSGYNCLDTVIVDDLGSEAATPIVLEAFLSFFDYRWSRNLPTIVTSNLKPNELRSALGERLSSRIIGLCTPVEIKGDDRRIKQAVNNK